MNHDYAAMNLDDLTEEWGPDDAPLADRGPLAALTPRQRHWREHGWVAVENLLSEAVMADYEDEWLQANGGEPWRSPGGWDYCTPHRDNPALARLVTDPNIHAVLEDLLGEPAGVHLSLTGWLTTTRDWHQDCVLNPPGVGGWYVAVWVALQTVHPDSGPFQFVDRSHLWPPLSQAKVRKALGPDGAGPDWPTRSERVLSPLYEEKIAAEGLAVTDWLPERGTVLFWHSRLLHRGSRARVPGMERRALIFHVSGQAHRPDMPPAVGRVFPVDDGAGIPAAQMNGGA